MTHSTVDAKTIRAFLAELSCSLDLAHTMSQLGLTPDGVRLILGALAPVSALPATTPKEALPEVASEEVCGNEVPGREAAGEQALKIDPNGLYTAFVDGASRGNPGLAGAGIYLLGPDGKPFKRLKKFLGIVTNNVAEYSALIAALESAKRFGIKRLRVMGDSELVVKQVKGIYRVKSPDLKPLYESVSELIRFFDSFEIRHVRRDKNAEADQLANEAIDTRK